MTSQQNRKLTAEKKGRYVGFSLLAGIFWGLSFPIVKYGLGFLKPFWFSALRMAFGCLLLIPFLKDKRVLLHLRPEYWLLGIFNALGFLLQFVGMRYTSASKASFYVNTNLIFIALFSWLVFRERFGLRKLGGIVLALAGLYFLSLGTQPISALFSGELKGDLLVLSAGFAWSWFVIINKRVVGDARQSVLETVTLFLFTTSLLMLPVAFLFEGLPGPVSSRGWVVILLSASVALALPFYLWTLGLEGLTPTVSALLILVEILVATGISFLFLGERLQPIEQFGAFLLLVAMVLASLGPEEE
jgi:drug/metabolite transporter (DMT)-like permease